MSTKVHSYLGGLNQDVTNKFEMTSNATVTVGNGTTTGNIHAGGNIAIGNISPRANGLAVATNVTVAGDLNVDGSIDLGVANITNDLSLSGGDGALRFPVASSIKVLDNSATSLVIEEADTAYMTIVTTDGSEAIKFDKALDINASANIDATVTVGVNDQGYDVKIEGDTAGAHLLWDSSADSLMFSDSTKAVFGAGSDLQIYHSGSDNMIEGVTDEYLFIKHDNLLVRDLANKDQIRTAKDGAVTLYYNSGSKIATTNTGVDVTGNIVVSGTVDGRDIAVNLPASLGDAGQILKVNDAGNAGEWGDLEAGVGYQNSSTSVIPGTENTDLGNLTDDATDAFGIALQTKYDLMDPIGSLVTLDLGAL